MLALVAVTVAILGNARLNRQYVVVFLEYLLPTVAVVSIMLGRDRLLELLVFFTDEVRQYLRIERRDAIQKDERASAKRLSIVSRWVTKVDLYLHDQLNRIRAQQLVYFTRGDHVQNLNRVMQYIEENEHTNRVKFVHVHRAGESNPKKLAGQLDFLDEVYPEIDIEFVELEGEFSPDLILELSEKWGIPTNLMFMSSPKSDRLRFQIGDLGGVRLII